MVKLAFIIGALVMLCSCGQRYQDNQVAFEGIKFSTDVNKDAQDDMSFTVVVKKASQSVSAAREAARYEGVKYCIEKISSSDIRWTVTPEAAELSAQSDTLSIKGRCQL